MYHFSPILSLLLLLFSAQSFAVSTISHGELVITIVDNKPCFSFPQDEVTKKRQFYFSTLEIDWNAKEAQRQGVWAWSLYQDTSSLIKLSPSTEQSCIRYGETKPGTRQPMGTAKPIQYDIPYEALMSITTAENERPTAHRRYLSWYCLSRDAKENTRLVKAEWNREKSKYECRYWIGK